MPNREQRDGSLYKSLCTPPKPIPDLSTCGACPVVDRQAAKCCCSTCCHAGWLLLSEADYRHLGRWSNIDLNVYIYIHTYQSINQSINQYIYLESCVQFHLIPCHVSYCVLHYVLHALRARLLFRGQCVKSRELCFCGVNIGTLTGLGWRMQYGYCFRTLYSLIRSAADTSKSVLRSDLPVAETVAAVQEHWVQGLVLGTLEIGNRLYPLSMHIISLL